MNEKEIKKTRGRFLAECTAVMGKTTHWYEFIKDPLEVLEFMEKEIKEAYHKGYMEGTMEAL